MVIRRSIILLFFMFSLMSCGSDFSKGCEKYSAVCQQLQQQNTVQAIVSLKLTSEQAEFERFLLAQGIEVISQMPVTRQWLLKLDKTQFAKLSQNLDVENIQQDKFHPR